MTKWKTLTSGKDYHAATRRIDGLLDIERTDAEENELSLLAFLVEQYDEEFHSIPDASPLEVVKFAMQMKGIKQQDLIPVLGTKGNVSKILSGKANIQLSDLHPLSVLLGIPVEALIPKLEMHKEMMAQRTQYPEDSGWSIPWTIADPSGIPPELPKKKKSHPHPYKERIKPRQKTRT